MKTENLEFEFEEDIQIKARPVLKWAGGKTQMLDILLENAPKKFNKYIEPFFGGGALFYSLQPQHAIISDLNEELVNLYNVVSDKPNELISKLKNMPNDKDFFLKTRAQETNTLSNVEVAARTIYLNKTCFNGLYRVNKQGKFNTPFANYKNPNICDEKNLNAASKLLKKAHIVHGDYKEILRKYAEPGDFIFLDPPYLPISEYSDFKRYTKEQFYEEDQIELANEVKRLHQLGCYVLLTNSNHPLVHDLYSDFEISVHQTKRNVNSNGAKRQGEDVLVKVEPKKLSLTPKVVDLPNQVEKYPPTRYMGSKKNLIERIWSIASQFEFESVTDLFSGSGIVSYMFKSQGKQVFSNDYMALSSTFTKALVENNETILSDKDIDKLLNAKVEMDYFVSEKFKGLYFNDADNFFIDHMRKAIPLLKNKVKESLAMSALIRACMKRRPRGIFTFVGLDKYDDGRRDLQLSLQEHFLEAVKLFNAAVFDNGKANKSRRGDAMTFKKKADLVYIDPPYYSPHSDNEYVRRYHFVEGLARDWQDVEIQENTKTKKFKNYPTPFSSRKGASEAFDLLFKKHKDSILIVSYSSNSLPTKEEMLELLAKHKSNVDVIALNHQYSFGNQNHKIGDNKNKVEEYLFVGY
ncbi:MULTISPECIES: Dam family site-specific DNA-(adenine-N6)-methyltransferase [Bacillus cereus group]|uniref:Dam family site-specific DNA-(adenine-N6)-methyltransferase n=1 Tax=Bacillus cereus group TaxID=86661 RepID=UPI0022E49E5A|nr:MULTISPECIES: Dam family site-specific DNA-(adenine-N6)-methyltransferase [unclassified Bacillus cereus group]MDA2662444.1 Dam family site-specific DNA-(adenine-N6)-methyltransferase [Bacillus cereus group sp. Bc032]MDA2673177.1 Dam family site-specific DNA-(adenine-N6)-methyltransferase [Bacillus cereus group sp. Bc031]MDA2678605.1 Dam family site-specific DNA-(adenine-N6)-methyltransferase [Bacillus cereus group sp. Bc029]MDA2684114.1 Dam family site-specific DNA-(adenine-N6)-methyltransfe